MGKAKIRPPTKSKPLNGLEWNLTQLITSWKSAPRTSSGGFWVNMWNIRSLWLSLFFPNRPGGHTSQPIFTQNGLNDVVPGIDVPFAVKIETFSNPWPSGPENRQNFALLGRDFLFRVLTTASCVVMYPHNALPATFLLWNYYSHINAVFITVRHFMFPHSVGKWHIICILPSTRVWKLTQHNARRRASVRPGVNARWRASTRAVRKRLKYSYTRCCLVYISHDSLLTSVLTSLLPKQWQFVTLTCQR